MEVSRGTEVGWKWRGTGDQKNPNLTFKPLCVAKGVGMLPLGKTVSAGVLNSRGLRYTQPLTGWMPAIWEQSPGLRMLRKIETSNINIKIRLCWAGKDTLICSSRKRKIRITDRVGFKIYRICFSRYLLRLMHRAMKIKNNAPETPATP